MGDLADRLTAIEVRARSADRQITARLGDRGHRVEVCFGSGAYRRYRHTVLAAQLGDLMPRLFERLRAEQRRVIDSVVEFAMHDDGAEFGPERGEYRRRVARIAATATDDGRIVTVSIRSLAAWRFAIAERATWRLTEPEFLGALDVAVSRVLRDYRTERFRIKDEVYGLGYPTELRRKLGIVADPGGAR